MTLCTYVLEVCKHIVIVCCCHDMVVDVFSWRDSKEMWLVTLGWRCGWSRSAGDVAGRARVEMWLVALGWRCGWSRSGGDVAGRARVEMWLVALGWRCGWSRSGGDVAGHARAEIASDSCDKVV